MQDPNRYVGNKVTSPPISLYINQEENKFYKAAIELYGVDVTGPSYEGRVFINNPGANENTPTTEESGYVGSYHIFGHNGCYGDEGHCDIPKRRPYDSRRTRDAAPCYKSVEATQALKKVIQSKNEITVTIVPLAVKGGKNGEPKDVVHIDRIRINCYENYLKLQKSG